MRSWRQFFSCPRRPLGIAFLALPLAMALCAILLLGCWFGLANAGTASTGRNTNVVVLLTSTANDQLVSFTALIQSIALG